MKRALVGATVCASLSAFGDTAKAPPPRVGWLAACRDVLQSGAQGRWGKAQLEIVSPEVRDQVELKLTEGAHVFTAEAYTKPREDGRGPARWSPMPEESYQRLGWRGTFLWRGTATRTAALHAGVYTADAVLDRGDVESFVTTFEPLLDRCLVLPTGPGVAAPERTVWAPACRKALERARAIVHKAVPQMTFEDETSDEALVLMTDTTTAAEETIRIRVREGGPDSRGWKRRQTVKRVDERTQSAESERSRTLRHSVEIVDSVRQTVGYDDKRPAFIPLDELEAALDPCVIAKDPS